MNEDFLDPLLISIGDDELNDVLDARIDYAVGEYKKQNLKERQDKNLRYFKGEHDANDVDKDRYLKDHRARYMDNVIYDAESYIKPIALSRIPDLIVKPTDVEDKESKEVSERLTIAVNNETRQRNRRLVMAVAHRHLPLFFIGAVKYRWNSSLGAKGDYEFCHVNPADIILDYVPSSNPDDMGFIVHKKKMPLKEVLIMFPDKKEELLTAVFGTSASSRDRDRQRGFATPIEIEEVWFSWYQDEDEVRREEFCLWRYSGARKVILKKMKNPNFDYEGKEEVYTLDEEGKEVPLLPEQLMEVAMGMRPAERKRVFRNYFSQPRKPFIFINYDWLGNSPYDDTSRIEQSILLQDNVDVRGRQITDIANTSRGRWAGSAEGGITKEDMERWDPTDPNQNFWVKEDVDKSLKYFPMEQPSAALFQDQNVNRQRIFQKMGVSPTTRGEVETDTATTAQLAREGDISRIDDLVETTINYLAEEMARASMHMIKLRYTQEHVRRLIGKDGDLVYLTLSSDMVEDGMEVEVFASGTDKLMRKREAVERASMNMTDPLTYFEDTQAPDPKGRTKRLISYLTDPNSYILEFIEEKSIEDMAGQLMGGGQDAVSAGGADMGGQEALSAIMMLQQGQQPPMPQQVTPAYVDTITNFINSPEYQQLPPEVTQLIQQFAQQVIQMAGGGV